MISSLNIPDIFITSELNHEDIRSFVNAEITQCVSIFNPTIRDAVLSSLLAKSDGMFLWVKLMLVKAAPNDHEVVNRLADLPSDLEKAYNLLLGRLSSKLDKHQLRLVHTLFTLTAASGRPLGMEELRYAYALVTKPESDSTSSGLERFFLRLQPEEIVAHCGAILTFMGGVFRIVHNSANDYLIRPVSEWVSVNDPQIHVLRVDPVKAHRALCDLCLRYLSDVDCSQLRWEYAPSLESVGPQQPLIHYACLYVAYHINRSQRSFSQLRGKISSLIGSDQCFFVLEYLSPLTISEMSMDSRLEIWILFEKLSSDEAFGTEIIPSLVERWEREYSHRISTFGKKILLRNDGYLSAILLPHFCLWVTTRSVESSIPRSPSTPVLNRTTTGVVCNKT